MKRLLLKLIPFTITSVVIYLLIAGVMIIIGGPGDPAETKPALSFAELMIDYSGLPELTAFTARDGAKLGYRYYPAQSDKVLIFLHGSGWHSRYFLPLARFVSSGNLAQVYTPDLRGHGPVPERRGDVDYIGQLEDDLADLMALIKQKQPKTKLIVAGHSSGGGLALRFAGSGYGRRADAYLLLAPYLKYNAPTTRPDSGGWARPYTKRIIGLVMLNNVGLSLFNHLTVIDFNMPKKFRDGTETLVYSYRLNTSYAPRDYEQDLAAIKEPLLVVAGTADKSFIAEQYEPTITPHAKAQVRLLKGVTHMGVVVGPQVRPVIEEWLRGLD